LIDYQTLSCLHQEKSSSLDKVVIRLDYIFRLHPHPG